MLARLMPHLGTRRGIWIAAVVGVVLCAPALGVGLVGDDYLWWLILQRQGPLGQGLPPLWHVYNFIPGGLPSEVLRGQGMVTWWADPELRIALLRPLSVLTYMLDHAIAPRAFALHHLHSLLWYGASIVVVGAMFRRVHAGQVAVAGLAVLLFAVADSNAMNAGWIANRHALISLVIGGGTFLCHLQWRQTGRAGWGALAALVLVVGLLAGESILGVVAYIAAWQLTLERPGWRRRLLPLVPYLLVIVVWRMVYNALGYGVAGSGLYLDPGRDPVGFFLALLQRWPLLQLNQWLQMPSDAAMLMPASQVTGLVIAATCVCGALVVLLWPLLRRSAEARFWALGMAAATVPLCAAFPMDRLLIFAAIGAFGLLATQVNALGWLGAPASTECARWRRRSVAALLLIHLPLSALLLPVRVATISTFSNLFSAGAQTAPTDPGISQQTALFVSGHEFPVAYLPIVRQVEGTPAPLRTALLASFMAPNRVTREDERTLLIEPERGFLAAAIDRLERDVSHPFAVGERIRMPDFTAEVRSVTGDGRPLEVAFRFDEPLESPRYLWLRWGEAGAEPFPLPEIGQVVVVPEVSAASLMPSSPQGATVR